jgi:glycosyltransferase involved in cell wall biosynthesis
LKILIVNTLYYPDHIGGAEVSTQLLAEGLVRAGAEVSVVCATGDGHDHVTRLNGVNLYRLRYFNLYWPHRPGNHSRLARFVYHAFDVSNVVMSRKLARIIRHEKPDVVHTSNLACLSVDTWRVARNAGVPIVHTIRDYYLMCPSTLMFADGEPCKRQCSACALYSWPKRLASKHVNVAVGVSRFALKEHLRNGYFDRATRTAVVNNPFSPGSRVKSLQGMHTRRTGPVRLGVLGRVARSKGAEVVLDQLLAEHMLEWTLVFGGTGEDGYITSLKRKYPDSRVAYLGHVNPDSFFPTIDILIVPSMWHEPFGRVIVEAYSFGVPVIGANRGGIPEIIDHRFGLLFDMDHPKTLIQEIRKAIDLLKEPSLKDELRAYADTFSAESVTDAYIDIYRTALRLPSYESRDSSTVFDDNTVSTADTVALSDAAGGNLGEALQAGGQPDKMRSDSEVLFDSALSSYSPPRRSL